MGRVLQPGGIRRTPDTVAGRGSTGVTKSKKGGSHGREKTAPGENPDLADPPVHAGAGVPGVADLLARPVREFRAGGPLGHTMRSGVCVRFAGRVRARLRDAAGRGFLLDGDLVPLGRVPAVVGRLEQLG